MRRRQLTIYALAAAAVIACAGLLGVANDARAQASPELAKQFAPSGKLRVGVLMLSYFAVEEGGALKGWSPDLGNELARRLGVPAELVRRSTIRLT